MGLSKLVSFDRCSTYDLDVSIVWTLKNPTQLSGVFYYADVLIQIGSLIQILHCVQDDSVGYV